MESITESLVGDAKAPDTIDLTSALDALRDTRPVPPSEPAGLERVSHLSLTDRVLALSASTTDALLKDPRFSAVVAVMESGMFAWDAPVFDITLEPVSSLQLDTLDALTGGRETSEALFAALDEQFPAQGRLCDTTSQFVDSLIHALVIGAPVARQVSEREMERRVASAESEADARCEELRTKVQETARTAYETAAQVERRHVVLAAIRVEAARLVTDPSAAICAYVPERIAALCDEVLG